MHDPKANSKRFIRFYSVLKLLINHDFIDCTMIFLYDIKHSKLVGIRHNNMGFGYIRKLNIAIGHAFSPDTLE